MSKGNEQFQQRMRALIERMTRSMDAIADNARLATDAITRQNRSEWEFPERVLSEEERAEIRARQMGRTLSDIDDLPEVKE